MEMTILGSFTVQQPELVVSYPVVPGRWWCWMFISFMLIAS